MKKALLFSCVLILIPLFVYGHGARYFEFDPDTSSPLNLSSVSDPRQIFIPQNEFLSGIDVWLDNPGAPTTLTVELYNQSDTLVSSKTQSIGTIASIPGGQITHIDLSTTVSVSGSQNYYFKFITSSPDLSLYYANRIDFIGHNQPQVSEYVNGVAMIDGEEKEYSFKFALYENSETVAPVVSQNVVTILSLDEARLDFHANEPVDWKIQYGYTGGSVITTQYTGNYYYCGVGVDVCSLTMNTEPDKEYTYTLSVRDVWANQTVVNGSFTSGSSGQATPTPTPTPSLSPTPTPSITPDTAPPVISNLRVVSVNDTSVSLAWTTDEAANSLAVVRLLPELITVGSNNDSTLELEHYLTVGNLPATSFLRAQIQSSDSVGNLSESTIDFTTTAPGQSPTPGPSVSPGQSTNPTPNPSASTNPNQNEPQISTGPGPDNPTTFTWNDTGAGSYRVDIFDSNDKLVQSYDVVGDNKLTLAGLGDGKYKVIVYEKVEDAYRKVGPAENFRAGKKPFLEGLYEFLVKYIIYLVGVLVALMILAWKLFYSQKPLPPPVIS